MLLLLVLEVTAIVVIAIINSHALLSFHNTTLTTSSTGRDYPLIERVWIAFTLLVSLVGEEVGMASISLPLIRLLSQTQLKNMRGRLSMYWGASYLRVCTFHIIISTGFIL